MDSDRIAERADLDPQDWTEFRELAHRALDDMISQIETVRERPVWVEAPDHVRAGLASALPEAGRPLAEVLSDFDRLIKPYATGNTHPCFMGWVHGAGTPVGMIAEMLAAGLNANCGGRNHIGLEVERQITRWMSLALGFPEGSSGLFVTGTSMANFLGLLVARNHALGDGVRKTGLAGRRHLCAYASEAAHGCIAQATELSGLGSDYLRLIPCDEHGRMRTTDLQAAIQQDRDRGLKPFLVVATAGSVDIGAIDPLNSLADIATENDLWLHVDGAFGALLAFSSKRRHLIEGIERAQSVAFDFHKWAHVPYDAGFLLVRDREAQRRTFASERRYLTRSAVGLASGDVWPCDLGPDLSRGFRALKTWFTLQVFGTDRLGHSIDHTCELAKYLEEELKKSSKFSLSAPVALNVVCFTTNTANADRDNRRIVEQLHSDGSCAPSITLLRGEAAIRCAIVNHRTTHDDIDSFLTHLHSTLVEVGQQRSCASRSLRADGD